MRPVDYDGVASEFDRRYAHNEYDGTNSALAHFVGAGNPATLEVGCGTGHWLALLGARLELTAGIDPSSAMLERAQPTATRALLVRATAERVPFDAGSFDRVFCINALHHFGDPTAFIAECRRVLRPGGAFMTIGLDPSTGLDRWWMYDYFPASLVADRLRYLPTKRIREMLAAVGFVDAHTSVAQHIPAERSFEDAEREGFLDRRSASQLLVISDDDFTAGMRRLRDERPTLRADLRLYATVAHLGGEIDSVRLEA